MEKVKIAALMAQLCLSKTLLDFIYVSRGVKINYIYIMH
jgi:hypothetical protein